MSDVNIASQASLISCILNAIKTNTPSAMSDALDRCLDEDARLRELFAQYPDHPDLQDPYATLIKILRAPSGLRMSYPREICSEADHDAAFIMPLCDNFRRLTGAPCIVENIGEFRKNIAALTEGLLSQVFPCKNVIVAGGAVQICLTPLPDDVKGSLDKIRKYYNVHYPKADINLFIWGLTAEQAIRKIRSICHAVEETVPCVVKYSSRKFEFSIIAPFPYRRIRIFLSLFKSASEVLSSLDIDCSACLYDGDDVYMASRAVFAMIRQANTVDMSRRSRNYEFNLAHYASRHFEIHVPNLNRSQINPDIYEKQPQDADGFLLLLLLERPHSVGSKLLVLPFDIRQYTPQYPGHPMRTSPSGETEDLEYLLSDIGFWLLSRNTQTPRLDPEALADWQQGVYLSSHRRFLQAIIRHRRDTFQSILASDNIDINQVDSQGLTPLHLAIITKSQDIALDLIDRGAKITQKFRDGRNALYMAAQLNLPEVIRKLIERSELNKKLWVAEHNERDNIPSNDGSTVLESFDGENDEEMEVAEGDILGIDLPDRETGFTPLCIALVFGCTESIEELIKAGANLNHITCGSETSLMVVEINSLSSALPGDVIKAVDTLGDMALVVDSRRGQGYYLSRSN